MGVNERKCNLPGVWTATTKLIRKARDAMKDTGKAVRTFEAIKIQSLFTRESGEVVAAYWAVVDVASRVRVRFGEQSKMEATADRWNALPEKVPSDVQSKVESARYLLQIIQPGDTAKTILRHVSRSGMMRHISVIVGGEDVTWHVARLLGDKRADDGGLKIGGCGMDMGFEIVYRMSCELFPEGFRCTGEDCRSNDHCNKHGDEYRRKNFKGKMHTGDGGYAIQQKWL